MHYADLRLHVALGGTCTLFPDLLLESSFKASISFPPPTHTHTHTHTHRHKRKQNSCIRVNHHATSQLEVRDFSLLQRSIPLVLPNRNQELCPRRQNGRSIKLSTHPSIVPTFKNVCRYTSISKFAYMVCKGIALPLQVHKISPDQAMKIFSW